MSAWGITARAAVVTIAWFMAILNGYLYIDDEPPRANVVSPLLLEMTEKPVGPRVVDLGETRNWDMTLEFMTKETFDRKMGQYRHAHRLRGVFVGGFALVVFVFGGLLGRGWKWAVVCLFLGPVAAAYLGHRESRKLPGNTETSTELTPDP